MNETTFFLHGLQARMGGPLRDRKAAVLSEVREREFPPCARRGRGRTGTGRRPLRLSRRSPVKEVCFPTETEKGFKAVLYGHFGSAPYFTIGGHRSPGRRGGPGQPGPGPCPRRLPSGRGDRRAGGQGRRLRRHGPPGPPEARGSRDRGLQKRGPDGRGGRPGDRGKESGRLTSRATCAHHEGATGFAGPSLVSEPAVGKVGFDLRAGPNVEYSSIPSTKEESS